MSQIRTHYPLNFVEDKDETENESDAEIMAEIRKGIQDPDEGGETMESDCETQNPDNLDKIIESGTASAFISGKRRLNKSIKCKKCLKGGHEDLHCTYEPIQKFSCHICEGERSNHSSLECPYIDSRCKNCNQPGHTSDLCDMSKHHLGIVKLNPWDKGLGGGYELPKATYKRLTYPDKALEFNYDILVNTDLNIQVEICQNQKWFNMEKPEKFFFPTLEVVEQDFNRRKVERMKTNEKFDLDRPPIPDDHRVGKIYCPVCLKEHLEKDCEKSGGKGDRWNCKNAHSDFHWSTMGFSGQQYLKGRQKRLAKFREAERKHLYPAKVAKPKPEEKMEI
jgi:hypothetical protein